MKRVGEEVKELNFHQISDLQWNFVKQELTLDTISDNGKDRKHIKFEGVTSLEYKIPNDWKIEAAETIHEFWVERKNEKNSSSKISCVFFAHFIVSIECAKLTISNC